jgi:hypothetical protein
VISACRCGTSGEVEHGVRGRSTGIGAAEVLGVALIPLAVTVATTATMMRNQILARRLAVVAGSMAVAGLLLLIVVTLFD